MKILNTLFLALLIIGGLNWGSIGLFGLDLVGTLFGGSLSMLSRIIFTIVGVSSIWAFTFFNKVDQDSTLNEAKN